MKKYAEKIGRGTFVIFVLSIIAAAIGYGFRIFLSRELTIDEFGLFYSVLAFVAVVGIFRELGLATSLVKHVAELRAKKNYSAIKSSIVMVFLIQLFLSLVVFVPLIIFADVLAESYFGLSIASIVLFLVMVEAIINMGLYSAVFQAMHRFNIFAFIEFARVSILFIIAFFFIEQGVVGIATAHLATTLIMNIIFVSLAFKSMPFILKEKFTFDTTLLRNLLKFGVTLWLGNIVVMLVSRIDVLVITYFRALTEVAWYNVSLPTAMLLTMFSSAVSSTLYPTISELWAKGKKEMVANGLYSVIKFFFVFMIPVSFVFLAFPELIITTLFGQEFAPAALSLQILSLGMLFSSMAHIFMSAINGIGRPDFTSKIVSGIAVMNLILNIALVPFYGLDGAALATTISFFFMFLGTFLFLRKEVSIPIHLDEIAKMIFGGVLFLMVIGISKELLVISDPIVEAAIAFSISMVFYLVYLVYGRIMVKRDLEVLEAGGVYIPTKVRSPIEKILKN
jgi:O-antigen/teichoic acid export membrane protein